MINQLTNQAVFGPDKKKVQQKIKVLAEEKAFGWLLSIIYIQQKLKGKFLKASPYRQ